MQRQGRPVMQHCRSVCNVTANTPGENTKKTNTWKDYSIDRFANKCMTAPTVDNRNTEHQHDVFILGTTQQLSSQAQKLMNTNTERRNKRSSGNQTNLGLMHWIVLKYAGQTKQCKHIMLQGTCIAEQSVTKDTQGYSCTLVHVLAQPKNTRSWW